MASTATSELTPYEKIRQYAESPMYKPELVKLLGSEEKVQRFIRVMLTAVQGNPELVTVTRKSLFLAGLKAAADGLAPDGKHAVFNVYNTRVTKTVDGQKVEFYEKQAQYLPMVAGIVKKFYDLRDLDGKPLVLRVSPAVVYQKDQFKYRLGDEPSIEHEPYLGPDRGEITHSYVSIKLANGEYIRAVMQREDIEKTRRQSKAPDSLMWKSFYDQGAIKAVIKRAAKQMPSSPELERIIRHDNEASGMPEHEVGAQPDLMDESSNPAIIALEDQRDEQDARTVPQQTEAKKDAALERAKANRNKNKPAEASLPLEGTATQEPPFTPAELDARLDAANSIDVLDLVAADISSCHFSDEVAKPLWAKYNARKAALAGDTP